jgi:hypothetical protein
MSKIKDLKQSDVLEDFSVINGILYKNSIEGIAKIAGKKDTDGCFRVYVKGSLKSLPRVLWIAIHNKIPKGHVVSMIETKAKVCEIDNLVLRTFTERQHRCFRNKDKSGKIISKGIFYRKDLDKWEAIVVKYKKNYYLGCFDEQKDAQEAYNTKAKELYGELAVIK